MEKFSYIKAVYRSFYSARMYNYVFTYWRGVGFLYLLMLITLCNLALVLVGVAKFSNIDIKKSPIDIESIINQIPEITIENGMLSTPVEQPYYIKTRDNGVEVIIATIDTTGTITQIDKNKTGPLLITSKTAYIEKSDYETRSYNYPEKETLHFNSQDVRELAEKVLKWLWVLPLAIFPFLIIASFIYRIIQVLIYALIGLLFAKILKVSIEYESLMRLTAVAITPAYILALVLQWFLHIKISAFIYLFISMFYLFFAIKSSAEIKK